MDHQPKITIGIPVYNGANWINKTMESFFSQTLSDFEVVICDNASTDNTEEVCKNIVASDSRVRYFRNEQNLGAPSNYNMCLEHARGVYFKWNSASDLCLPTMLESCIDVLEKNQDVAICYFKTRLLYDDGVYEDSDDNLQLLSDRPSERFIQLIENIDLNNLMNGVMRREQLESTSLVQQFTSSDFCLMAELALLGKIIQIPEYLFIRHSSRETSSKLASTLDKHRYIKPNIKEEMPFQMWALLRGYYQAIKRSSVSKSEKRILYAYILKMLRWERKEVFEETLFFIKRKFSRT